MQTQTPTALEPQWTSQIKTRTGIALNLRSASPSDRPAIRRFLRSVSPADLRFRFLSATKPSEALVRILTDVDHRTVEDLVGFDPRDKSVAATAMIAESGTPGTAEIAILVRSDLAGHGIGWEMLKEACEYARVHGFERVECVESSSNTAGVLLESEQGFVSRIVAGSAETTILTKDLS